MRRLLVLALTLRVAWSSTFLRARPTLERADQFLHRCRDEVNHAFSCATRPPLDVSEWSSAAQTAPPPGFTLIRRTRVREWGQLGTMNCSIPLTLSQALLRLRFLLLSYVCSSVA
jgi:hypothetical protein